MINHPPPFEDEYTQALHAYLDGQGEAALQRAYELGRRAMDTHLGILELSTIHHRALAAALADNAAGEHTSILPRAVNFFAESLSSFEMALSGFQDAMTRLHQLNATLEAANTELHNSREQLRALSAHLQSAREQERTRIAREIHDELAQSLTGLKMDVSWLRKNLGEKQELLHKRIEAMSQLVDATVQTTRRIATELRPGILDDLGLPAAIEWQLQEFETRAGIRCKFVRKREELNLHRDCSTAVFRILQEALTNVARHAGATQVEVILDTTPGDLILEVRDNGRGIKHEDTAKAKSFGLIGIQERVHLLAGAVQIRGAPGQGTVVIVRIPLTSCEQ
jgi:signal transduction histidine kinase